MPSEAATNRYVKEGQQQRTVILRLSEGRLTGNLVEMLQQFRKEWLQYFQPYSAEEAPDWDTFVSASSDI